MKTIYKTAFLFLWMPLIVRHAASIQRQDSVHRESPTFDDDVGQGLILSNHLFSGSGWFNPR
jgi:hypothetical protein